MKITGRGGIALIGGFAMLAIGPASAMAGAWTIPGGSTDSLGNDLSFTYSNGGDVNGLFGDPFIFNDAFFFTTAFSVLADDSGPNAAQGDALSVDILADPGLLFGSVSVSASGSFSIISDGEVDVSANLSMSENDGLTRTFGPEPLITTPVTFPISTPGSGNFTGDAMVDVEMVFPTPSNDINITLTNDILAISGPGGSAEVNIQFQDLSLTFNLIPEPSSMILMAMGSGVLLLSRRRRRGCP